MFSLLMTVLLAFGSCLFILILSYLVTGSSLVFLFVLLSLLAGCGFGVTMVMFIENS